VEEGVVVNIPAKYRKAIYIGTVAIALVAIVAGVLRPDEVSETVAVAGQVTAVLASLLALFNITPDE
jgi:hypothetical protein